MDRAKKRQPKGFLSVLFLLLCLTGAAAGVVYLLTGRSSLPQAAVIAGAAVSCNYALGALVCACSRKSGGVWLLTVVQVLVSAGLLALAAFAAAGLLTGYFPALGETVDSVRELVGLEARGEGAPSAESFMLRAVFAGTVFLALIHALTSFSVMSALNKSYKGIYKPAAAGFFGFVSLLLAAAQGWLFSLMSWACPGEAALTNEAAAVRSDSAAFSDTLSFGSYALSDWAMAAWILSSVLASLTLAFFAFGLAGKLRAAAREAVFEDESEVSAWEPASGSDEAAVIPAPAPETGKTADSEAAWDDDLLGDEPEINDTPAAEPVYSAPLFSDFDEPESVAQADEEAADSSSIWYAEPAADTRSSEPAFSDPYEEFADVSVSSSAAAAASVPGIIPGTGIFDYGYSENAII